jgi:peptidoglycan-associated lipoprotein
MRRSLILLTVLVAVPLVMTGCATKKYVQGETQAVASRVDDVEAQVEENQTRLDSHEQQINQVDSKAEGASHEAMEASKTAKEALQRAQEAGKLAEGKLLYEEVLTDNDVKFGFESATLSDSAKAAIDQFAQKLTAENKGVYVEIQGHTDSTGPEDYNQMLGLQRAEAVMRYLNSAHDFPLHRMNVISYGESEPIADNNTREGRAQNRRVSLVVLQ